MEEFTMGVAVLRQQLGPVLSAVAYGSQRVVIVRHGRVVGALIGWEELQRLQQLPAAPPVMDERERREKLQEAKDRRARLTWDMSDLRKALEAARERGDALAIANAEIELEEARVAHTNATQEIFSLDAPRQ